MINVSDNGDVPDAIRCDGVGLGHDGGNDRPKGAVSIGLRARKPARIWL
jgi:hypothetical protein